MRQKKKNSSGVFLMEMIVVVFFFIVCASICILAFAKADRMSRLAADRNQAVILAQSAAEVWKLEGGDGLITRLEAECAETEEDYSIRKDGLLCAVSVSKNDLGMHFAELVVMRAADSEELFRLSARSYERASRERVVE